ncbi:2OG-Fe(II) oxygenase [Lacimicrobium alkaliphilum]|uniref:Prolyl 4-hydroxylase subunit alpha n=1 Tax=Lacimicrobium alkaliphilum TaxID=1526571 RepID=A0ABQ1R2N3_9ALTE|nr:2OG-Fe(II) oxygenase [Lacimicrobium alkaliphilum]GGD56081.1 prolyl 4-hydroxylase subunit alpha [Lacimicrobium alkaliphilum]
MTAVTLPRQGLTSDVLDKLANDLNEKGYCLTPALFPINLAQTLLTEVHQLNPYHFEPAGIGRELQQQQNQFVRTDAIHWLKGQTAAQQEFLMLMEELRMALNRRLFMGLFDYECHFAHYGPGDFYKKHLDAFKGRTNRVLSTVYYLNPGWSRADEGELLMYERGNSHPFLAVTPLFGQMLIFLSERFPHEVKPARRDRYSIAGWFRVNGSIGGAIDPPA